MLEHTSERVASPRFEPGPSDSQPDALPMSSYVKLGGGVRGVGNPPKTQKSQKATPPDTPLKSSGIATTLKPNSNPPKNFRD